MFPLRDENPTELTPFITMALVAANVIVWIYLQGAGVSEHGLAASVCTYGTIPVELTGAAGESDGVQLTPSFTCEFGGLTFATLFTSMFLHGSWVHLLGNLWFLWLFGNNVEDSMGHLRFLLFYILVGLAASGAHVYSTPDSPLPTVGASGAISGVMGAYLVLYPRIRIQTLVFIYLIYLPAWVVLAEWFVIQIFSGFTVEVGAGGGVAFWAHIGGFVAGAVLVRLFENRTLVQAKKQHVKLDPSQIEHRGWW